MLAVKFVFIFFCTLQTGLLEVFIKVGVSSKTQPPLYMLNEAHPLLLRINHDNFREQLLPAMQKAMLRNPEIILQCVGKILSSLSLDLSQYALDIGKNLTSKFYLFVFFSPCGLLPCYLCRILIVNKICFLLVG